MIFLQFHAEIGEDTTVIEGTNKRVYETFLNTRNSEMETKAVEIVAKLCEELKSVNQALTV